MNEILSKYIGSLSSFNIIQIIFIIILGVVNAGNIIELHRFLITIPVLEWILNYQVLIVLRQIIYIVQVISVISFCSDLLSIHNGKLKGIEEELKYLKNTLNRMILIVTLVYGLIIIEVILQNIEMSILLRLSGIIIFVLLFLVFRYVNNKWEIKYNLNKQQVKDI